MSDSNREEVEMGQADEITMDEGIRTVVAQMFEHDNDTAYLEVTLENTKAEIPPVIVLRMQLVSINGVKTKSEEEHGD